MTSNKQHWENIYTSKQPHEVSWTQEVPATSLDFIRGFNLPKTASMIDIGGGDSKLVDFLLMEGFKDITVLDSYNGIFPCFFLGRFTTLFSSILYPLISLLRVSSGVTTSSIYPFSAARYGLAKRSV